MNYHYSPIAGHIRLYHNGSYENRDPYDCIVTIQWLSDEEVWLSGAHGSLSTKPLHQALHEMGVKRARYERNGKEIVTLVEP